jgi:hypothetical protein
MDDSKFPHSTAPVSSPRTFGEYSQILRAAVADEESLQMSDSLQNLSEVIERLTEDWRLPHETPTWQAPYFLYLLDALREHHAMVLELTQDWQRFLEFKVHMAAVNQLRSQLAQWIQWARMPGSPELMQSDFDVSAWRLLGTGALLLDAYEQTVKPPEEEDQAPTSAWSRLVDWIRNED